MVRLDLIAVLDFLFLDHREFGIIFFFDRRSCVSKTAVSCFVNSRCGRLRLLPCFIFCSGESHLYSLYDQWCRYSKRSRARSSRGKHSMSLFRLPKLLPALLRSMSGLATIRARREDLLVLCSGPSTMRSSSLGAMPPISSMSTI